MKKFLTTFAAFALVATTCVFAETTTALTSSASKTTVASSSSATTMSSKTSKSKGYTTGKTGGKAIKAIYDNYKKEGKLNLKSASNIVNITLIGTSFKGYKDKDSDYKSDFNTGLLEGLGLKSDSSSSSSITDALSGLSDSMSGFSSSSSSSDESSISSALTDIFEKLK